MDLTRPSSAISVLPVCRTSVHWLVAMLLPTEGNICWHSSRTTPHHSCLLWSTKKDNIRRPSRIDTLSSITFVPFKLSFCCRKFFVYTDVSVLTVHVFINTALISGTAFKKLSTHILHYNLSLSAPVAQKHFLFAPKLCQFFKALTSWQRRHLSGSKSYLCC